MAYLIPLICSSRRDVQHRTQCATSSSTLLWTTVKKVEHLNRAICSREFPTLEKGEGGSHGRKGGRESIKPLPRETCRKTKNKKEKGSSGLTRGGNSNDIALVQLLEFLR